MELIIASTQFVLDSAVDVLPIATFLFAFQWLIVGETLANWKQIVVGFLFVVAGLGLFLVGLEETLFPLGRLMAQQLTDPAFLYESVGKAASALVWQDYYWVYLFALAIGFSTTLAEPALIAVSMKANTVSGGAIGFWGLRVAVAIGVGVGAENHRTAGIRLRRRYDVYSHCAADYGTRTGPGRSRAGTQSIAGRIWPGSVREPVSDNLGARVRSVSSLERPCFTSGTG
jgi:hypothetical protein